MRGYPKYLSNRNDYEYVRTHFPKSMWEKDFKGLLDYKEWFNAGEIENEGTTDDTHKVVTDEETGKKYQYEYKENPNAKIFQLGYKPEDVQKILGE